MSQHHAWRRRLAGATVLLLASACGSALPFAGRAAAQPAGATTAAPRAALDPAVAAALRAMSANLAGAASLTVQLSTLREAPLAPGSDQLIMLGATTAVAIRRPDRLAALVGSDRGSFRLWFDGETAALLSLTANAYALAAVPGGIEGFLDALETRLGVDVPLRDLLAPDPMAALVEPGTSGAPVGRTVVGGELCDHFALRNREVDWQIWISVAEPRLPCRLVVVDRVQPGAPRAVLEFQEWRLAPALDDDVFTFVAPPDAEEVPWLERQGAMQPGTDRR